MFMRRMQYTKEQQRAYERGLGLSRAELGRLGAVPAELIEAYATEGEQAAFCAGWLDGSPTRQSGATAARCPGVGMESSCREIRRLLEEYDAASARLLQAFESIGTSPVERGRWERITKEARRICGETLAAIQSHRFEHGC